MRKTLLLSLPFLACLAVAAWLVWRPVLDQPPKGKVLQKLEDHFAGPWGWIEDYEGREWLVIGKGRVRVPYSRETVGIAAEPDGWMSKKLTTLAGDLPFPVVYRIDKDNAIDCIWRAENGELLYGNP